MKSGSDKTRPVARHVTVRPGDRGPATRGHGARSHKLALLPLPRLDGRRRLRLKLARRARLASPRLGARPRRRRMGRPGPAARGHGACAAADITQRQLAGRHSRPAPQRRHHKCPLAAPHVVRVGDAAGRRALPPPPCPCRAGRRCGEAWPPAAHSGAACKRPRRRAARPPDTAARGAMVTARRRGNEARLDTAPALVVAVAPRRKRLALGA